MLSVQLDRLDHQVECMDTVHFARHAVGTAWREAQAFGEVEQAIHTLGVAVQFSTRRSAIAVAMVVLKRMLPQSENGVLVVMIVERLWLWRVEIT